MTTPTLSLTWLLLWTLWAMPHSILSFWKIGILFKDVANLKHPRELSFKTPLLPMISGDAQEHFTLGSLLSNLLLFPRLSITSHFRRRNFSTLIIPSIFSRPFQTSKPRTNASSSNDFYNLMAKIQNLYQDVFSIESPVTN